MDDKKRNNIVKELGLLYSHPTDKSFNSIVTQIAFLSECSMAFFSVLSNEKQYVKSAFGLPAMINLSKQQPLMESTGVCAIDDSFCKHTLTLSPMEPLIIPDTYENKTLKNNPFVMNSPFIRFYAGFPIQFNGVNIGALCCADSRPKDLRHDQIASLYLLRDQLVGTLHIRQSNLKKSFIKRLFSK